MDEQTEQDPAVEQVEGDEGEDDGSEDEVLVDPADPAVEANEAGD